MKRGATSQKAIWIAISLAAHVGLLFAVRPWMTARNPENIEVVMVPPTAHETQAPSAHPTQLKTRTKEFVKAPALRFAPSFVPSASGDLEAGPTSDSAKSGEIADDPSSAWGSGGGEFGRVADLSTFDKFYSYVDGQVQYPGVLAYHGIEGTVNARLIVAANGECDWHRSHISSTQSHLRVYILDVLKQVCTHNLARFAHKNQSTNFDLSFKFAITEHDDQQLIASEKKIVGNVFLFYRNSQQSIAEWHIGPFRGMFPVPYIALDFSWLQENYEKVMYSRDPLRDFKDHVTEEPHG